MRHALSPATLATLLAVATLGCAARTGAPVAAGPHAPAAADAGPPPPPARPVGCADPATSLAAAAGAAPVAIACPPGCADGPLWGTGVYTADSSMCLAAVHAGLLAAAAGGVVRVEIRPGQDAYLASTRHGVTSQAWGSWPLAFRLAAPDGAFPADDAGGGRDAHGTPPPANLLGCDSTAASLPGHPGTRYVFTCPPGCSHGAVWGSIAYTDDSAICVAAVHAGVTSTLAGGAVAVTLLVGLPAYPASQQNGVATAAWGLWQRSFRVDPP